VEDAQIPIDTKDLEESVDPFGGRHAVVANVLVIAMRTVAGMAGEFSRKLNFQDESIRCHDIDIESVVPSVVHPETFHLGHLVTRFVQSVEDGANRSPVSVLGDLD